MTFGSTFGRTFSPTFQPKSQAAKAGYTTWWTLDGAISSCVAAYGAKGASSLANAKINLANPGTYNLSAVNGDVGFSTANGFESSRSNNYKLNTGVTIANKNYTMIIRFSNYVKNVVNENICGYWNSSHISAMRLNHSTSPNNTNFANWTYDNYSVVLNDSSLTSGVMCTAGSTAYLDGTSVGTITQNDTVGGVYYICGRNYSELSVTLYTQAFAIYNSVLTSTQVASLTTAMNAL